MAIKPLTFEQQLKRLKHHNIIFSNNEESRKIIININYFRIKFYASLLGEWLSDNQGDKLAKELDLKDIYSLYLTDLHFSAIILSGIISIEKYLRSKFACVISCEFKIKDIKSNDFLKLYKLEKQKDTRDNIINKVMSRHRNELPFQHNLSKYGFVPPWCFIEYTECGDLIKLIKNLNDGNPLIAKVKNKLLAELNQTNLQILKDIRNKIAHGNPLINNCQNGQKYSIVFEKMFKLIKNINPIFYGKFKQKILDFESEHPEYVKLLFDRQNISLKKLLK